MSIGKLFPAGTGCMIEPGMKSGKTVPEDYGMKSYVLQSIDAVARKGLEAGAYPGCRVLVWKDGLPVSGLYAHSRQDTRSLHAILPGGIYDHRRSMCRTEVQRPNVPRPEKGVAQHLRAGTSYRKGGYALFRTSGFLPGRAGTGKRMQYRPQENTSGIPLYG